MKIRALPSLSIAAVFAVAGVSADAAAPRANPSAQVGGKSVSIEYGRPALGERAVSELLSKLPADRMWRAGSEQVTTFVCEGDVLVGGHKVPAGRYSVYLHVPEEGPVDLVLNSVVGQPLSVVAKQFGFAPPEEMKDEMWPHFNYAEEIADTEIARVPMTSAEVAEPNDLFTIELAGGGDGAKLTASWGDRSWSVGIQPAP